MNVPTLLGYGVGIVCIIAALSMILQKNPIYSGISLIVVMLCLSVEYLMLGAEFLAAMQVIVYAGTIMVMFVFVTVLLHLKVVKTAKMSWGRGRVIGMGLAALFGIVLLAAVMPAKLGSDAPVIPDPDSTRTVGRLLFSDYVLPFELVSVLLIVAIIGAVVLTRKKMEAPR